MKERRLYINNMMKKLILILTIVLFLFSCGDHKTELLKKSFSAYNGKYAFVITKNRFTLEVYDSGLNRVNIYKIGIGSNPDMKPKSYEGDNRTPEGVYEINEILSIDSEKNTDSYKKLFNMNKHYFKKASGHHKYGDQNADLGDNAYGPRYFGINYPNDTDKINYSAALERGNIPVNRDKPAGIGYGIAIHGNNDEESIGQLCSNGCIRMFNRDVVELEKYLILKTPVIIMP
ncbi:MAG: L,D-transpeptidase [Leptospirales bacterium]|nr:L,D-transpeptidase [Leptospirales bacterium]